MKRILLLLLTTFTLSCCNNDDDNPLNLIDQLPPATQTGANTFGALLDGEPFIPSGGTNPLDCVYQLVNGEYYFTLQGNKRNDENILIRLGLGTENLEIIEGQSYNLLENVNGNCYGKYFYGTFINYTSNDNTGKLTITKLDTQNQIVSGTFWYNIEDQFGVIHEIRDGRFDMQYSQ